MTLQDYEKWLEGWKDGLFLAGELLEMNLNLLEKKDLEKGLRSLIKMMKDKKETSLKDDKTNQKEDVKNG